LAFALTLWLGTCVDARPNLVLHGELQQAYLPVAPRFKENAVFTGTGTEAKFDAFKERQST